MNDNHSPLSWEAQQQEFIDAVSRLLKERCPVQPGAFVQTYGCQQNVSDSERFKGILTLMGYRMVDRAEEAELILFNTCAVREHAEERVFGNVGALKSYKKAHPSVLIILCGCMTQQESTAEKVKKSYPFVDMVLGTNSVYKLPELIYERLTGAKRIFDLDPHTQLYEEVPVRRDGVFKGWLPVMYGCDNFCSYCIVPYVRGRERSRRPADILAEFTGMVKAGYKDITLLGQNVNSYGKGEGHGTDFAALLRMLNAVEGDFVIRFMTSHPKDCTEELLDAMRDCSKVSPHLHLPFQSGSDRILSLMNRRYDRERYLELIRMAKAKIPDLVLTSDVIVGFPGETYGDFCETMSLVETVGFTALFTFLYSPRKGTPAAVMDDLVPMSEKKRWFSMLLQAQEEMALKLCAKDKGKIFRVLCEEPTEQDGRCGADGQPLLCGRTAGNQLVEFSGPKALVGQFARVKITQPGIRIYKGILIG